jgi:hypothetical protein
MAYINIRMPCQARTNEPRRPFITRSELLYCCQFQANVHLIFSASVEKQLAA